GNPRSAAGSRRKSLRRTNATHELCGRWRAQRCQAGREGILGQAMTASADVLIIGGGVIGSSIAFNLLQDGFKGRILVVERDASYQFASSALAMGGVRQQFMSAVNIRMVQYSSELQSRFDLVCRLL